jgi:hypothetical protein
LRPTVAYKLNPDNAVGLSLLFVYQQFGATGLQAFGQASLAPSNLTNNNTDSSTGVGLRLGYLGKVTDKISLGASYSPKVSMSRFDKYAGLFAESGKFDIPENYALGASIKATPELLIAVDYQRINYAGVPSVGNPSSNIGGCMMGNPANCLGGSSGPGFGWKNINVWKVGVEWQATPQWTLRAGVNVANNPVQSADVTFNIIAPRRHHVALHAWRHLRPLADVRAEFCLHARTQAVRERKLHVQRHDLKCSRPCWPRPRHCAPATTWRAWPADSAGPARGCPARGGADGPGRSAAGHLPARSGGALRADEVTRLIIDSHDAPPSPRWPTSPWATSVTGCWATPPTPPWRAWHRA